MTPPLLPRPWFTLPNSPVPGTRVATLDALPDGMPSLCAVNPEADPDQAFGLLVLRSGTQVTGFVNRCAHFGVPLAARQDLLIYKPHISISCNVHYARYRWADGYCEWGECEGESLIAVPLEVHDDGSICIAKAATTQPQAQTQQPEPPPTPPRSPGQNRRA